MSAPLGYNPRKNPQLDRLRKQTVSLLAFSAAAYAEKCALNKAISDLSSYRQIDPTAAPETFAREILRRMAGNSSKAFCTDQPPFLLLFGCDTYVAFVPDLMGADELTAFRTAVALQGIFCTPAVAKKAVQFWSYSLGLN